MIKIITTVSCVLFLLGFSSCSSYFRGAAPRYRIEASGLYLIAGSGGFGFIDQSGKVVIAPQFQFASHFSDGLARVSIGNRYGFIDKAGKFVINPQFDYAGDFSEGYAFVTLNNKTGVIDKSGRMVIAPQFEPRGGWSFHFVDGLAPVSIDGKVGYIDTSGRIVTPPQFPIGEDFSEGLAVVRVGQDRSNAKCGFIDKEGKLVIAPQFVQCHAFSEGFAVVGQGTYDSYRYVFIDKSGKVVANDTAKSVDGIFSEGLVGACLYLDDEPRCGHLNSSGLWAIRPTFYRADNFSDGLAKVDVKTESSGASQAGYIDKTGEFVISPQFSQAGHFFGGLAQVILNNSKPAYIDKTGKIVWQEEGVK